MQMFFENNQTCASNDHPIRKPTPECHVPKSRRYFLFIYHDPKWLTFGTSKNAQHRRSCWVQQPSSRTSERDRWTTLIYASLSTIDPPPHVLDLMTSMPWPTRQQSTVVVICWAILDGQRFGHARIWVWLMGILKRYYAWSRYLKLFNGVTMVFSFQKLAKCKVLPAMKLKRYFAMLWTWIRVAMPYNFG